MAAVKQIIFTDAGKELEILLKNGDAVVITDVTVKRLYRDKLFGNARVITLAGGERCKNLRTIDKIYSELIRFGCDRKSVIVAVGGGVVCDTAGFAAATFKRGTGLVLVPTTLLAQADAAVGGKNGVDFKGFKNVIGSFREPDKIIIDTAFLRTLDKRNFNNGAAELIKTALIGDKILFDRLKNQSVHSLNEKKLPSVIRAAAEIKSIIVRKDLFDKNIRKVLNFGHTIGHAIELSSRKHLHGEAVAIGIVAACRLSEMILGLKQVETKKIAKVLELNSLPVKLPVSVSSDEIMNSIVQDKKKNLDKIDLILLKNIGEPVIHTIKIKELKGLLNDIR